jgi:hypothetical protein
VRLAGGLIPRLWCAPGGAGAAQLASAGQGMRFFYGADRLLPVLLRYKGPLRAACARAAVVFEKRGQPALRLPHCTLHRT